MKETVWSFTTENFEVRLCIEPEDTDPADSFEFAEDIKAVRDGTVEWFAATVEVLKNGHVIGSDHLGCCAYKTVREFYESHRDKDPMNRNCSLMRAVRGSNVVICHYFPGMVYNAIADARHTLEA